MQTNTAVQWDILALYDAVMAEVEPDLTRANLPTLQKKYKRETPEQRHERAERYAAAYLEWQDRLKKILALWEKELLKYRDGVLKGAKIEAEKADSKALGDIATSIDAL